MLSFSDAVVLKVAESFEAKTLHRGLRYAMDERVMLVSGDDFPAVAKVRGTQVYIVTVDCNWTSDTISGSCSCPVGVDCKHAVAAALVVLQRREEDEHRDEDDYQARAVGEWLAELGTVPMDVLEAPRTESSWIVAYLIEFSSGSPRLAFHRTKALKRGGLARSAAIGGFNDDFRNLTDWMSAEDFRLMNMARATAKAHAGTSSISLERLDTGLMQELASTGRLFWNDVHGMSLRWAAEKQARLAWQPVEDAKDSFHLGLGGELLLVCAHTPLYIDLDSRCIGPLDLGLPPLVVESLVTGPDVPREMLATAETSLRGILSPAQVTVLFPDVQIQSRGPALIPRFKVDVHKRHGHNNFEFRLEACYGDAYFPLSQWARGRGDPNQEVVRSMAQEGRYYSQVHDYMGAAPVMLDAPRSAQEFLQAARYVAQELAPQLIAEGWQVQLSDDLPAEMPIMSEAWVEELRPVSSQHAWLSFGLGVSIDGRQVDLLPMLLEAIKDGRINFDSGQFGPVQPRGINLKLPTGDLVYVPRDRLQRWVRPLIELRLRGLTEHKELRVPSLSTFDFAEGERFPTYSAKGALEKMRERLQALSDLEPKKEGKSFVGELRGYQRQGLAWLRFLHDSGYGGLLCDDMGLGKTVQLLAFADGLRASRKLTSKAPILVLAPRSVVGNWHQEATRFAPKLRSLVHLGAGRGKSPADFAGYTLIVTSYQTLLRDIKLFAEMLFTSVILDEAQAIKNPDTKLRRAVARLTAQSRFCVSGTPIENHLGEIWSQVDWVMPGLLGSKSSFRVVFRKSIEESANKEALEFLRKRLRPFLLRRTKADVDIDLPEKTEMIERIILDTAQRDLYESLRVILDKKVRDALKARGVQASSLIILDALLRLRQCCCDPRLVKTAEAERTRSSAKLDRLMAMLDELTDAGRSVLVFSQFTSMLELIEVECQKAEIGYLKLTGATQKRDELVRRFQDGEAPVFLISLKAGGVGLNLTRADTVIHYDPWWNPAVERQASDRVHRIGQDKKVMVYKLVAQDTLEERICVMQSEKQNLSDAALHDGGMSHFGAEDLQALFQSL